MSETARTKPIKYVTHALAWLLACAGVLVVDLLISLSSGLAIMLIEDLGLTPLLAGLDESQLTDIMQVAMQVTVFAVALIWFCALRGKRGSGKTFSRRRESACRLDTSAGAIARRVALVVAAGFALQVFVAYASNSILVFFPDVARSYSELMDEAGMDDIALIPILTTVIGAPISEELMVRGVLFEFALRAFDPAWDHVADTPRGRAACAPSMRSRAFWAANIVQAAAFGIMHMNIVQGCYAFVAALALGWVFYRTGRIRYSILMHFAFNASSYFMGVLWFVQTPLQVAAAIAVSGVLLVAFLRCLDHQLSSGSRIANSKPAK